MREHRSLCKLLCQGRRKLYPISVADIKSDMRALTDRESSGEREPNR